MKVLRMTLILLVIIFQQLASNEILASLSDSPLIQRIERSDNNDSQKPVIDSISELTYHIDEYVFTLEFTVYFHGTDIIHVELEEDSSTSLRDYIFEGISFDDIYMVHVKTGRMSRLDYCWVTVVASNEYGTTKQTIEIPPHFTEDAVEEVSEQAPYIKINGTNVLIKCGSELNVSVASLDGKSVYNEKISRDTEIPLKPGIYILNCKSRNSSYTKKIMIR
ncbi:MAG: T9SS type A sorting domain-containing protein [Muribaculaceae bacterium]|nr:T9SS type A sorting domain-containing protein [Muribaculaceae bacterium]